MQPRPFSITAPPEVLTRIGHQLGDARVGYAPGGSDWELGTSADYLAEFIGYWREHYDWRRHEAEINTWPQFLAEIDGVDIHFVHVRADGQRKLPLLLTHGWPGSIVEFMQVVPLLRDAGFDLVIPSLPGFSWSGKPTNPVGPRAVANMWRKLMTDVLGYSRFIAQGGDWGSAVTFNLGTAHADVVEAIHLNFFMAPPLSFAPDDGELQDYWQDVGKVVAIESGYQQVQQMRPQTLGLALHDNPVGWASWVLEKFQRWGDCQDNIESRFSKDQLITNLMFYLVPGSVISSLWIYHASRTERSNPGSVSVLTGLARYPGEFYPMPSRRLASMAHNVVHWQDMPSGGHFAAMEEPALFAANLIDFASQF